MVGMLLLLAITADPAPIPPVPLVRLTPVRYEADVAPLFAAKCTVCHSGKQTEGRLDLGTYAGLMKGGKRGPAVVPGKAGQSLLWLMSTHRKKPVMPPKSEDNPLTPREAALLQLWIDGGAVGPATEAKPARPRIAVGLPPAMVTPVRAVAVAPDKSAVAVGRGNKAFLLDPKTGAVVRPLTDPTVTTADGKPAGAAHRSLVEAMAFSPDGKTLATGSFQELALWDVATGKVQRRIDGFADRVVALAFAADGKRLAAAGGAPTEDGEVKVFDPATGKLLLDLPAAHSDTVFGVAFSPDGKLLATGSADKFAKVFDAATGKPVRTFEGHTQHVLDVAWAADGKRLVSAGADAVLKVWDVGTGEKVRDVPGHKLQITRLAAVGKGPTVLTAGGDGTVRLYNADTGGQMRTYPGAADFVYAVAASPDGAVVAAGGEDGFARLYDGASGKLLAAVRPGVDAPPAKKK